MAIRNLLLSVRVAHKKRRGNTMGRDYTRPEYTSVPVDDIVAFRVDYAVPIKNFGYFMTLRRRFGELRSRRRKSRTALTRIRAAAPRTARTAFAGNRCELDVRGEKNVVRSCRCVAFIRRYQKNYDPKTAFLGASGVKKTSRQYDRTRSRRQTAMG